MSGEILINITPMETRVCLVENGVPQEVAIERNLRRGIVGNIYKGKVVRVLPGMQAAFIDIGLEKAGFLHVADLASSPSDSDERDEQRDIRALLHDGQQLLVQVMKEPIGSKGPRLSAQLSLSSRYLVYMPSETHIGVSQRIEDEEERNRLRSILFEAMEAEGVENFGGGYIMRTAAEGADAADLLSDVKFLTRLWAYISEQRNQVSAPTVIYEDMPLYKRVLRDMARPEVEKIRVDSKEITAKLVNFANKFNPEMADLIENYDGERPLFYLYGVEDEITKALERKVQLKSGGYLVIDQTEAMTTIDINTGAFVGRHNLEETIFKTNLEAANALARQLRMRNLGGIIIIDFIDMTQPEHRRQILRALEKALERDRAKTSITGVTELGLVQMTRKRTSESLGQTLCEPCAECQGKGRVKSAETVSFEIMREILRESRAYECESIVVLASQSVIDRLLDEDSGYIADLEEFIGRPVQFRVETQYGQEQFDIIPV